MRGYPSNPHQTKYIEKNNQHIPLNIKSHKAICYAAGNSISLLHGTLQLVNLVGMKCNLKSINDLRTASLLHDIGHGPFSHVFKTTMKWINGDDFNHEKVTEHLIKYEKEINKILKRKVKIY